MFRFAYFDLVRAPVSGSDFPTLAEAVVGFYRAQPDLVAATSDGKLWEDQAPEATKLPYVTFLIPSDTAEEFATGPTFHTRRAELQINCHHWTSKGAKDLARTFRDAFKMAPLAVAGVGIMHCLPTGPGSHAIGDGLGDHGRDCHVQILTFEVLYTQA